VQRVLAGRPKKGLIWHFQGSGNSLLMVFAAQKLRLLPALGNPTVLIVVDRIDLDVQISSTFHASDVPNLVKAETRADLQRLLQQDARKIIITTIFKFGEADGILNDRGNIVVMVDEAHRTQEGDLGLKMRAALPNAFLFGLTGTPINRRDRNTFWAFGAEEDARGYMSRYGIEESIREGRPADGSVGTSRQPPCPRAGESRRTARPRCLLRTRRDVVVPRAQVVRARGCHQPIGALARNPRRCRRVRHVAVVVA
jgi:type I restriction enzyme R subunit